MKNQAFKKINRCLKRHLAHALRLPVSDFERITSNLCEQGYAVISDVDHLIARIAFFDTYHTFGVATWIMGITQEGWKAVTITQLCNLNIFP